MSNSVAIKETGLRWLWLAVVVFLFDIGSKFLVINTMEYGPANRIDILPFFSLNYVHNYGAAFSFLSDQGGWQRWFFATIAVVVTALLCSWMKKLPATEKWNNIAYTMIIGGALGNVFDRIVHGYVIDFLDVHLGFYDWPVFNIADVAICIGAIMIVLESFKPQHNTDK
ncbi:signal peptidase II [Vibrio sp.]|nr:signal peptidase II [Vibrio sp.]